MISTASGKSSTAVAQVSDSVGAVKVESSIEGLSQSDVFEHNSGIRSVFGQQYKTGHWEAVM